MYIGVDLGSTNLKAALYDEKLNCVAQKGAPVAYIREGEFIEFDAEKYFDDLVCVLHDLMAENPGKVLLKNVHRTDTLYAREVAMSDGVSTWVLDAEGNRLPISTGIAELADGQNTVTVTVQVSTGELLTAYTGTLTK
jgi:sugar (pentulose or hexulose) kinase